MHTDTDLAKVTKRLLPDSFVEEVASTGDGAIDFLGESLDTAHFKRARVSPLYTSKKHGLFGYLELSEIQGWSHPQLLGPIEVPKSIIEKLRAARKDERILNQFADSFGVDIRSPDNIKIAPFFGAKLAEDTYYNTYHPGARNYQMDGTREMRIFKYSEALHIMLGYMSRMDQWITHALDGKLGKTPIKFLGRAEFVTRKRDVNKLPEPGSGIVLPPAPPEDGGVPLLE